MKKQSVIFVLTAIVFLLAAVAYPQGRAPMPPSPAVPQPPVITALHPSVARAGTATLAVFVVGQNFYPGISTAQFNGSDRPTVVFNSEVLAFELMTADLAQPKTAMVSVVNRGLNQSFTSNDLVFVVLP